MILITRTVVWVDENTHTLYPVVASLERAGYMFETYPTADGVLDRLRRGDVDLVMLELKLPGGVTYPDSSYAGSDLLRDIKSLPSPPPVLLFTVLELSHREVLEVARIGFAGHTRIPALPSELEEEVERILG